MNLIKKYKLKIEARKSYIHNKNKFNYISFKEADTKEEFDEGKDKLGNPIYVKSNLENGIIYFGDPFKFNDDREFRFSILPDNWDDYFFNNKDLRKKFKKSYREDKKFAKFIESLDAKEKLMFKKKIEILNNFFKKIKEVYNTKLAIYCLAPSPYIKYFWKNYTNNFNGICCEYDFNSLNIDDINFTKKIVCYSNKPILLNPEDLMLSADDEFLQNPYFSESFKRRATTKNKELDEKINLSLAKKDKKWKIEKENRLIMCCNDKDKLNKMRRVNILPIKIYIGYQVSREIQDEIINICNHKGIDYEIVGLKKCY